MSLPVSIGDIVDLVNFATKAYNAWNDAGNEYSDISSSLDSIIILRHIEDDASASHSILHKEQLQPILQNSKDTVRKLDSIIAQNKNLSSDRQGSWDRLSFGMKDHEPLRTKLTQDLVKINAYQSTVHTGSLGRIESSQGRIERLTDAIPGIALDLAALKEQVQGIGRRGSIMTTYDNDEKGVWRQFGRDLIGDGMRSSAMRKYTPQIRQYLRELSERERLGEVPDESAEESVDAATMPSAPVSEDYILTQAPQKQAATNSMLHIQDTEAHQYGSSAELDPMWSTNAGTHMLCVDDGPVGTPEDMSANFETGASRSAWKRPWAKKRSDSGFRRR